jgi:hypothetical protein
MKEKKNEPPDEEEPDDELDDDEGDDEELELEVELIRRSARLKGTSSSSEM